MPDPSRSQLRKARGDLAMFADLLGEPLTSWQAGSLQLRKRTTVVVAPRQTGKSRSVGKLALHTGFRKSRQQILIISAGEDAAKRLLAEVRRVATSSPLLSGSVADENSGLVTLSNGSQIRSVAASERQVRGWSIDLLIVDECSQVDDALLLGAAIPTTAARPDAKIVLASSPAGPEGSFYSFAELGGSGSDHVDTYRWKLADATWIGESVVEAARTQLPPELFAREFEAEFADVGADERVIDRRWIGDAKARSLEPSGEAAYGLDVARSGADKSVLALAVGGVVRTIFEMHGADLMTLTGRVARTVDEQPAPVHVDATGVGAGCLDRLRELGYDARPWVAAGKPWKPDRYANRKAESWWAVRELFRDGRVDLDPGDTVLAGQLGSQRYALTSSGRIEMVSKRAMGGPSPDHADAAVIALWASIGGTGQGSAFVKVWRQELAAADPAVAAPELRHLPRFRVDGRAPLKPGCRHRWRVEDNGYAYCVECSGERVEVAV